MRLVQYLFSNPHLYLVQNLNSHNLTYFIITWIIRFSVIHQNILKMLFHFQLPNLTLHVCYISRLTFHCILQHFYHYWFIFIISFCIQIETSQSNSFYLPKSLPYSLFNYLHLRILSNQYNHSISCFQFSIKILNQLFYNISVQLGFQYHFLLISLMTMLVVLSP